MNLIGCEIIIAEIKIMPLVLENQDPTFGFP
jgi:hypothetical protein